MHVLGVLAMWLWEDGLAGGLIMWAALQAGWRDHGAGLVSWVHRFCQFGYQLQVA